MTAIAEQLDRELGVKSVGSLSLPDERYNATLRAMKSRRREFASELEMRLAALAATPGARERVEARLDALWRKESRKDFDPGGYDEVIVGAGMHAAIYSAVRVAMGKRPPLVLERSSRAGGVMAVSAGASFWTNSRNRSGPLGEPGEEGTSLNVLPEAPVQPAMVSGTVFPSNADMAFPIRQTLARNATVRLGCDVAAISYTDLFVEPTARRFTLELADERLVYADRVLDARGLGDPIYRDPYTGVKREFDGNTILNVCQHFTRMDQPFPLRGQKRRAVVGAGDSANCVIESLFGLGPVSHMSVAGLDTMGQVDWYNRNSSGDCFEWREAKRGRYAQIGDLFRPPQNGRTRVRVFKESASIQCGFREGIVNGRAYDEVIVATGWGVRALSGLLGGNFEQELYPYSTPDVGYKLARQIDGDEVYQIGPCAQVPLSSRENATGWAGFTENNVALFRYGRRTATLAATLFP